MRVLVIALLLLPVTSSLAQQVLQVRWPSAHTATPVSLSELSGGTAGMIRFGLSTFSEETIISTALGQGQALGLSATDAANLRPLLNRYYARVRSSPLFKNAPSALSYCYSERKPAQGLATVYVPPRLTSRTRTILFIHGYGGSLLAYLHYLASTYPDHLIICPAFGVNTDKVPFAYVTEAQQAIGKQLKFQIRKPLLIGFSAGTFGAARIYIEQPSAFSALLCIAGYAPAEIVNNFSRNLQVRYLVGGRETYVTDGSFAKQMRGLRTLSPRLQWHVIPGAGHFFLFSHESQTKEVLRGWEKP